MKKIICLLMVMFCMVSIAFAQGSSPGRAKSKSKKVVKKKSVKKKIDPEIAEAEKAWIPFYESFRTVVKNKDKQGLYDLMAEDFHFPCAYDGGYGYQGDGVGRSFEIKKFDGPTERGYDCTGWETLEKLKKVSRLLKKGESWGTEKYPTKIVGEKWFDNGKEQSACRDSKYDNSNCGWDLANFHFINGKWYLANLDFCECE